MVATSPKKKGTIGIPQEKYRSPSRVKKKNKPFSWSTCCGYSMGAQII